MMKRKNNSETALFIPRVFVALLLCLAGSWLALFSYASVPSSAVMTESSAPITYTAGPFNQPNQSPVGAGQLDSGPRCTPASTFPCDSFDLTLHVTSGYTTTHPNAAVKVTMSWVDKGTGQSDYDLYIYKGQVPNSSLSGNTPADYQSASGSNPEVASIAVTPAFADGADHHFTIKIVPYTPTGETVSVTIEFLPGTVASGGGGFPGFGGADATVAGNGRYLNFYAPDGTSAQPGSGEFNIGYNPATGRIMTMNSGPIWRLTPPELFGKPECCEALWEDKSSTVTDTGLDPILWTDQNLTTSRTFASNNTTGPNAIYAYTDNDGDLWVPVGVSLPTGGADHQTIGSGPYPAALSALATAANRSHAVYYCSQDVVGPASCARSDTLGASYGPGVLVYTGQGHTPANPPVPGGDCGGLHGHIHVAPDGTAWLPVNQCGGLQGGVFSADGGTTWVQFLVPNAFSQIQGADPSIAIDANSTIYYSYVKNETVAAGNPLEGHAHVATGHLVTTVGPPPLNLVTYSINWTHDVDIGRAAVNGDKGIVNAAQIEAVGGSATPGDLNSGRAAVGFVGTDVPGDYQALSFSGKWYAFISTTYDGGATWTTVNATPNDPVQSQTGIWQQGGGAQDRNLLDFNEITVDDKGNALYGYSDGCTSAGCVSGGGPNDFTAWMRVARQSGGRSIFASHDTATDLPGAPRAPKAACLSGSRDNTGAHLSWKVPDNGGADITSYQILRSTTSGAEVQIATYSVGPTSKAEYTDPTAGTSDPHLFYKIIAVNSQGPGALSNEVDLPIVVPPAPQSPCTVPGVTVLTDASGDSLSPEAGTDMLSASVAQPYVTGSNPLQLVFTIKTDPAASSVHPSGSAWYLAFKLAGNDPAPAPQSGFHYRGVRMEYTTPTPSFFWYVPGANTSGSVDGRFVDAETATPGNYDPSTGTITITVNASALGLSEGSQILGFVAGSSQTTDPTNQLAGATEVWDPMPNSLAFSGGYAVAPNATCAPLQGVVSRKHHGAAGDFDIPLPLTGTPGEETRGTGASGNSYSLIYTFATNVTSPGTATSSQGSASTATGPAANQVTVTLTGVNTAQHLTVNLTNVVTAAGTLTNLSVPMDVLVGDVNLSKSVDGNDVSAVQGKTRSAVTSSTFRNDVNASGGIDGNDVSAVQARTRTSLL